MAMAGGGTLASGKRLKVGDKVSVPALQFDDMAAVANGEQRWSQAHYGARWRTAVVAGVLLDRPTAGKWQIEFEDGDKQVVERRHITLVEPVPAAAVLPVRREDIVQIEGDGDISSDESSEDELVCDAPAGAIPQVSGTVTWSKEASAPTHDQRSKQGFKGQEVPVFHGVPHCTRTGPTLFELWLAYTPLSYTQRVVALIDEDGRAKFGRKWHGLDMGKFVRWVGMWHQMLAEPRAGGRRAFWSQEKDYQCYSSSQWSFDGLMGLAEFETIYTVFKVLPGEDGDPFRLVWTYVDAWNANTAAVIEPGYMLVPDESMFSWTGRNMPGFSYVPRKPRCMGLECKTVCCGLSKVLLRLDI
jgi:hypothetical protein